MIYYNETMYFMAGVDSMRSLESPGLKFLLMITIVSYAVMLDCETALSYQQWSLGCADCHGDFGKSPYISPSPVSKIWPESLHTVHSSSLYMNTDCEVCHMGVGSTVYLDQSAITAYGSAPGYGCAGCHGRLDGSSASGKGLRQFHMSSGYGRCYGGPCHMLPEYADPEDIMPPNYGGAFTNVDDSCNMPPLRLEDWSEDGEGLDNDGDLLLDMADTDCAVATGTPTPPITPTVKIPAASSGIVILFLGVASFLVIMHRPCERDCDM